MEGINSDRFRMVETHQMETNNIRKVFAIVLLSVTGINCPYQKFLWSPRIIRMWLINEELRTHPREFSHVSEVSPRNEHVLLIGWILDPSSKPRKFFRISSDSNVFHTISYNESPMDLICGPSRNFSIF